MALQYVGGTTGAGTSNGYTVSLSGTLTGGIASSPAAGDIVIVVSAFANNAFSAPNVTGNNNGAYTGFKTAVHVNDTWDTEFRTFYKVMGATVDTSLTITRATSTAYGGGTIVQVWRGQHPTNPINQNYAYTTIVNSARAVPPNATPTCDNPIIISFGAGTSGTDATPFGLPPEITNGGVSFSASGSTSRINLWGGWISGTNGVTQVISAPSWKNSSSSSGAAHTIVLAPAAAPRDIYWVGGSGIWDTTNTTNWSTSSGGSGGADVPTAVDSVFFDNNSGGTYTVTQTGPLECKNLTVSAGSVTFATGTTPTLSIVGNLSLTAGTTTWNSTGDITFSSITQTVDTNGTTINASATLTTGTLQLLSNFTLATTATFTLTTGTLDLNNYTLTTGLFSSSNSNTRSIAFGTTGQINLTSATTSTIWTTSTLTNFSYTGTSKVVVTGTGSPLTITTGSMTEAQALNWYLELTSGSVNSLAVTKDIVLNGAFTLGNNTRTIYGNYTIITVTGIGFGNSLTTFAATSGTQTLTSNGYSFSLPMTKTGAGTLQLLDNFEMLSTYAFTLSQGTLDLNGYILDTSDFKINDGTIAGNGTIIGPVIKQTAGTLTLISDLYIPLGLTFTLVTGTLNLNNYTLTTGYFVSTGSSARSIAFGDTGQIIITYNGVGTVFATGPTNFSITGTSKVVIAPSGGNGLKTISTGALTEEQALNFYIQGTAGIVAFTAGNVVKDLTINGTITLNNIAITIYGNYTYTTATALQAGANAWTFGATSGTQTLTSNGLTHNFPMIKDGAGTLQLAGALTLDTTKTFTLTNGTLSLNNYTLSTGVFATGAGTKNIAGDGAIIISGSGATAWNNAEPTNFTITQGANPITISMTNASAKTFVGGSSDYSGAVINQGGAGALTITGDNTFGNITNSYGATGATSIIFTAGTTTTFNDWNASGTADKLLTIGSTTISTYTFYKNSGTVNAEYLYISYCTITGGATWNAGFNSVDGGDNSTNPGWIFGEPPPSGNNGSSFLMFFV